MAVVLNDTPYFNLDRTFDCGQAFRWRKTLSGSWCGIVKGEYTEIKKENGKIYIDCTEEAFNNLWKNYFDLDTDYKEICQKICQNEILSKTVDYGMGIRILNQDPFEALCSFIISQNNNIPRIMGIIDRLCENFGTKIKGGYSFPSAQKLSTLTLEDLAVLRSGFRAKYILDAAKKVASGEIDLEGIKAEADLDTARNSLMQIYGVGKKVADCTLLFGMGRKDAFPEDVWIKRAVQVLFNGNFPKEIKEYAGVAQQFLFFYARETKLVL